jgi:tRNA/rRNA methyltransferase
VRLVLVRPEASANIGACARVVRNTGLQGLDLVAPGDWRTVECWRTAWAAHDVLEEARVFDGLGGALAQTALAVAFTGKRDREVSSVDVREAAADVAGLVEGERGALVFGPESSGLTRDELALCGRRATIPVHPDQPSLNLSHAVMVAAYELFRAAARPQAAAPRATHEEKERLLCLLREGLIALRALSADDSGGYFAAWRNLFQRSELTPRELRLLEHMARKMTARAG